MSNIKLTKVQSVWKVVTVRSMYVDAAYHLQIGVHAHRSLFLVGVEETIGIPFITVGSPNLGQAIYPLESRVHTLRRSWSSPIISVNMNVNWGAFFDWDRRYSFA